MATSKGIKVGSSSSTAKKASSLSSSKNKDQQKQKTARSEIGAPSQLNQSSRKGKKAWRKHVDIGDVEQTLEEMRAEERVTGTTIGKMQDTELFQIDTKGDDNIRKSLPRFSTSQLTSTKILSQRSAVPAVFSRITSSSSSSNGKRKATLSREEKERLMRIAKKPRKGPFNSILDPSEYAPGSGIVELSQAVKQSGAYDPWAENEDTEEEEVKDGLETTVKKPVKAPATTRTRDLIDVPAILEPHQGSSYNPPVEAHQELLEKAASVEEKRLKDAEKLADLKAKMENARLTQEEAEIPFAAGMTVQEVQEGDEVAEDEEDEEQESSIGRVPERKTKAQRNKAARAMAEKRALAEKAVRKRLLASINDVKSLRRSTLQQMTAREKEREMKRLALAEKLRKHGLVGKKLGKHKVPEGRIDVQLGEDLSESLRGLKPEGSLFHDRFQSLQQRALIEPRARVLPKKRKHKIIEYEKPAWKRFE